MQGQTVPILIYNNLLKYNYEAAVKYLVLHINNILRKQLYVNRKGGNKIVNIQQSLKLKRLKLRLKDPML